MVLDGDTALTRTQANPDLPVLIRQAAGVQARAFARFGWSFHVNTTVLLLESDKGVVR